MNVSFFFWSTNTAVSICKSPNEKVAYQFVITAPVVPANLSRNPIVKEKDKIPQPKKSLKNSFKNDSLELINLKKTPGNKNAFITKIYSGLTIPIEKNTNSMDH